MWELLRSFHISTVSTVQEKGTLPLFYGLFMTEKLKNLTEISEILINYAETIIDLATELQYLLVEQEGIKEDRQKYSLEKVSELRLHRSEEERTQDIKIKESSSVSMQKLYIPVFRLSQENNSTVASIESEKKKNEEQ